MYPQKSEDMSEKETTSNVENIIEQIQTAQSGYEFSRIMHELDQGQITTNPAIQQAIISRAHDLACQCKRGILLDRSTPNLSWIAQVPEILHTASFQSLLKSYGYWREKITDSFRAQLAQPAKLPSQHEILLLEIAQLPILAENLVSTSGRMELESLADSIRNASDPTRIVTRVTNLGNLIQYPTILFAINSRAKELVKAIKSKVSLETTRSLVQTLLILADQALYKDNLKDFENIGLESTIAKSLFTKIRTKLQNRAHIKKILQSEDSDKIRDFLERMILNFGWQYTRLVLSDIAKDADLPDESASIIAGSMSPLGVIDIGLILHCVTNKIQLPTQIITSALGNGNEYSIEVNLLEEDGITVGFESDCHRLTKLIPPNRIKANYLQNSRTGLILSEAIYRRPGVLHYLLDSGNPDDRKTAQSFLESVLISNVIPSHIKKDASKLLKLFQ